MDIGQNKAYIGQNTSYRPNIGQNENIGIGIGGRYVCANISVAVSAKILAGRIYLYRYRLDPYRFNPSNEIDSTFALSGNYLPNFARSESVISVKQMKLIEQQ